MRLRNVTSPSRIDCRPPRVVGREPAGTAIIIAVRLSTSIGTVIRPPPSEIRSTLK